MADRPPDSGIRASKANDVLVSGHNRQARVTYCRGHQVPMAMVQLRHVGWLDQKGRVYALDAAPGPSGFDGGSLTPLLIDVGCD